MLPATLEFPSVPEETIVDPRTHADDIRAQLVDDPTITPKRAKNANLSSLMKAKNKARDGSPVNFCPFGCSDDELDSNGYCDHLVGFTNNPKKGYEPLVFDEAFGHRRVKPKIVKIRGRKSKIVLEPCQPGDKYVRITTDYRVYRDINIDKPPAPEEDEEVEGIDKSEEAELQRMLDAEEAELKKAQSAA